jgi:YjbE family integral membrane protein
MELFSPEFFSALMAIVLLDLVLAGDNAIVIGLAARNVPPEMQRRVILWGTAGAIVIRALLTLVVVWLLKIPGFLLAGGLALVWIAWNLTKDSDGDGHHIKPASSVRGAIQTIVIADAVMGVDNVLAIGGAAHGSMLLVVLGLLISIPIVVWGSQMILKLVDRFPIIIILGAGVLGWTAAKMISSEPLIRSWFEHQHLGHLVLYALCVGGVTLPALWRHWTERQRETSLLVGIVVLWLGVFDLIEEAMGWEDQPVDTWQWWHEGIDLAMWLGWVPVAVMVHKLWEKRHPKVVALPAHTTHP